MSGMTALANRELLTRLLEAHERSTSYNRPAPWPRDVILKLDLHSCPEIYAPDGREKRALVLTAARELESRGCLQVICHTRGPLAGEPKELRLSPANVRTAYEFAQQMGFEPLATGLSRIEEHASCIAGRIEVPWMRDFLEKLAASVRKADLSILGMQRDRFKREWRELVPALTAAAALASGIAPAWERIVSERLLSDSKLLSQVRSHVVSLLLRADPRWDGVPFNEAGDLLEVYGVRRKPGLIRCAGMLALHVNSRIYNLEDFVPVAHLPDGWADSWIEAVLNSGVQIVTTVENEYPFLSYVEEAGGPVALGRRGELVLYTAGFPTPALANALALLSMRCCSISFRHWGDADVGGVRIWWFLRQRLRRSIELFRTTAAWVEAEMAGGGRRLSESEKHGLRRLQEELEELSDTDIVGVRQLIDVLLKHGIKLEQERFG
jgi:Wadjet anti plasmid transformation system JetA-like protein